MRSKSLNLSAQGNVGFTAGRHYPFGQKQTYLSERLASRLFLALTAWEGLRDDLQSVIEIGNLRRA